MSKNKKNSSNLICKRKLKRYNREKGQKVVIFDVRFNTIKIKDKGQTRYISLSQKELKRHFKEAKQ